jgi:uncharacterized protein YndB with AHSA1/START domain
MLAWLAVIPAAVLVILGVAATRPAAFRITRSRTLAAPPEAVFALVNDFGKWPQWSPWEKLDPGMRREVSTPSAGTGATYHWVGNKKVGEGRMAITESQAPGRVATRLEFIRPWKVTNATQFDIVPSGAGSQVTWTMTGENNLMARAFGLFMDMDKLVGRDFEKGLAQLDAAASGKPQA